MDERVSHSGQTSITVRSESVVSPVKGDDLDGWAEYDSIRGKVNPVTQSGSPPERPRDEPQARNPGWIRGLLLIEMFALVVALVTPFTPSKTGSNWRPGTLFSKDPTYLLDVFASFLLVNALLLAIGLLVWITSRLNRSD
jgi:hypothetical protein